MQDSVVASRDRLVHLVDRPRIQRAPLAVGALHLVGDQHVRVQVRVSATGVEVRELSGDDASGFHLLDAAGTHAGVDRIVLGPSQGLGHGLMV